MESNKIREAFLKFFESKGHVVATFEFDCSKFEARLEVVGVPPQCLAQIDVVQPARSLRGQQLQPLARPLVCDCFGEQCVV